MAAQKKGMRPLTDADRAKSLATRRANTQRKVKEAAEEVERRAEMAKLREINQILRSEAIDKVLGEDTIARHPALLRDLLGYATTMMLAPVVTGVLAPTSVKEAAAAADLFHKMLKVEQGARAMLPGAATPEADQDRKRAIAEFGAIARERVLRPVSSITEAPSAQAQ